MKKHLKLFLLVDSALLAALFWTLRLKGASYEPFGRAGPEFVRLGALGFLILFAYEASTYLVAGYIRIRRGSAGEVTMLSNFLRVVAIVAGVFILAGFAGMQTRMDAVFGAFTGMFLGMVLQTPVSGFFAWVLVTLLRPFRVGDRVIIHGITGDVEHLGLMYTTLNQVGGTVGSEERANRGILIPNTTLWGAVVTNFTPQQAAPYVLDEVVVRFTFDSNWEKAEQILLNAAREVTARIIQATEAQPYIRADLYDYGILMRVRYMTEAMDRPRIVHEISKRIVLDVQRCPDVDFIIPFVYSYKKACGTDRPGTLVTAPPPAMPSSVPLAESIKPIGPPALRPFRN